MATTYTELKPIHDGRKSFYKKAKTYVDTYGDLILRSYETDVAKITLDGELVVGGFYSPTTTRHIREFVRQEIELKFWSREELSEYLGDI